MKERMMSGIQPTGHLHLGRYFGAIQNWEHLQRDYECYFCVVNYHAITMPYQPAQLHRASWDIVFNLLACGIHPEYLFIQSMVPEHTELAWILGAYCPFGLLSRMTQFKDKSQQVHAIDKDSAISSALFTYPVLQAADILIYNAHKVPVGKDQEQHLELARDIALRFNTLTGHDYFNVPEGLYTEFTKIMSTADPSIKMSASKGDKHNIDLFAEPEIIAKQIRSAVTASSVDGDEMNPGVANLFLLLRASGGQEAHDTLMEEYTKGSLQYSQLKAALTDQLIAFTTPFRERKADLLTRPQEVKDQIMATGLRIRAVAQERMREIKELAGLV